MRWLRPKAPFRRGVQAYALLPAAWLYALGWEAYRAIYRWGWKRAYEPHRPVVTIGNRSVGGSGKTPLTIYVGQLLEAAGFRVVVSASGYGSPAQRGAALAPAGALRAAVWGDEPAMIRTLWPSAPLIVGRDRVAAARICHERFPDAVLLMDDGFQHLRLRQHVTIVLDSPDAPNPFCLPAGPFREPRSGLRRADLVLPGEFRVGRTALRLETPEGQTVRFEVGQPVDVLCAIGSPWRFVRNLEDLGLKVGGGRFLPDHDPLTAGNLLEGLGSARPVVMTAKDWVKVRERDDWQSRTIWIAHIQLRVEPEVKFREWLEERVRALAPSAI